MATMDVVILSTGMIVSTGLVITTWTVWLLSRRGVTSGPRWARRHGAVIAAAVVVLGVGALAAIAEPRFFRMLLAAPLWMLIGMAISYFLVTWRYPSRRSLG